MKEINIAGQGVAAVEGHLTSQKHKDKVPSTNQNMICFEKAGQDKPQSTCKEPKQQSIDVNVLKQDTLKAEILWSVEVVASNYSYRSCEDKSVLFSSIFPDGKIASQFQLGKTKCAYMITFGIAPYVSELLYDALKEVPYYSLSFDESFNRVMKKSQMDLLVRYWDNHADMVTTRYLQSGLLGKAAATDVCQMFLFCAGKLDQAKFLQVMSDGPNVNLKFPKILNEERSESELKLKAMNKIFHESPSRRADYEKLTLASEQVDTLHFSFAPIGGLKMKGLQKELNLCGQRWLR